MRENTSRSIHGGRKVGVTHFYIEFLWFLTQYSLEEVGGLGIKPPWDALSNKGAREMAGQIKELAGLSSIPGTRPHDWKGKNWLWSPLPPPPPTDLPNLRYPYIIWPIEFCVPKCSLVWVHPRKPTNSSIPIRLSFFEQPLVAKSSSGWVGISYLLPMSRLGFYLIWTCIWLEYAIHIASY